MWWLGLVNMGFKQNNLNKNYKSLTTQKIPQKIFDLDSKKPPTYLQSRTDIPPPSRTLFIQVPSVEYS